MRYFQIQLGYLEKYKIIFIYIYIYESPEETTLKFSEKQFP